MVCRVGLAAGPGGGGQQHVQQLPAQADCQKQIRVRDITTVINLTMIAGVGRAGPEDGDEQWGGQVLPKGQVEEVNGYE